MVPPIVTVAAHVAVERHPRHRPCMVVAPFQDLDDDQCGDWHADPAPPEARPPGPVRLPCRGCLAAGNPPVRLSRRRRRNDDRRPPRSWSHNWGAQRNPHNIRAPNGGTCDCRPSLLGECRSRSREGRSRSASDSASHPAAASSDPVVATARTSRRYVCGRDDHQGGSQHEAGGRANDCRDRVHPNCPASHLSRRGMLPDVAVTLHTPPAIAT